jgi:hypothetical protein
MITKNKYYMNKRVSIGLFIMLVFTVLHSSGQQNIQGVGNKTDTTQQNPGRSIYNIDPNASPENVMYTIFQAAKTGEVEILKSLLPPFDSKKGKIPCDVDCKALCNPGNESMKTELKGNYLSLSSFKDYFSTAKMSGDPIIVGDEARVPFLFGPKLENKETMNLQRINGKWYLLSF